MEQHEFVVSHKCFQRWSCLVRVRPWTKEHSHKQWLLPHAWQTVKWKGTTTHVILASIMHMLTYINASYNILENYGHKLWLDTLKSWIIWNCRNIRHDPLYHNKDLLDFSLIFFPLKKNCLLEKPLSPLLNVTLVLIGGTWRWQAWSFHIYLLL